MIDEKGTFYFSELALAGAILLPCHDPLLARLYDEYGDDWLGQVKRISDEAARAYAAAPKQMTSR